MVSLSASTVHSDISESKIKEYARGDFEAGEGFDSEKVLCFFSF